MEEIILTVQPHGKGKFRLGVNTKDSCTIFQTRYREVCLILDEYLKIKTKTTCGPLNSKKNIKTKKDFDIYDKKLNEWIQSNQFHCYERGKPPKLKFQLLQVNECIRLKQIKKN